MANQLNKILLHWYLDDNDGIWYLFNMKHDSVATIAPAHEEDVENDEDWMLTLYYWDGDTVRKSYHLSEKEAIDFCAKALTGLGYKFITEQQANLL